MGKGWGRWSSGEERSDAGADEAYQGGGGDEVGNRWIFPEGVAVHKREGGGAG
jgi:hypothetical protein